jgi:hypothetical protein
MGLTFLCRVPRKMKFLRDETGTLLHAFQVMPSAAALHLLHPPTLALLARNLNPHGLLPAKLIQALS